MKGSDFVRYAGVDECRKVVEGSQVVEGEDRVWPAFYILPLSALRMHLGLAWTNSVIDTPQRSRELRSGWELSEFGKYARNILLVR